MIKKNIFQFRSFLNKILGKRKLKKRYDVDVFRTKGRLLIYPWVLHKNGNYFPSGNFIQIDNHHDIDNEKLIGSSVLESFFKIDTSEALDYDLEELEKNSPYFNFLKFKSWKKFLLNSTEICLNKKIDDNKYIIAIEHRIELDRHPDRHNKKDNKEIELPLTASPEEIGRAVIEVLDAGDKIYNINTRLKDGPVVEPEPFPMLETYIFHDYVLNYKTPEFDGICDHGEKYHSEIFRCFTYKRESDKSDIASIVIGAAINFTSEFTEDDAKNMLEKYYKNSKGLKISKGEFGIFTHKLDVKNEKIRMITYFLNYADGSLLDCEMIVHNPFENEELVKEFEIIFEKFVKGIKISKEV